MYQAAPQMVPRCTPVPWGYMPRQAPAVPNVIQMLLSRLAGLSRDHGAHPNVMIVRMRTLVNPQAQENNSLPLKLAGEGLPAEVTELLSREYSEYRSDVLAGWCAGVHEKVAAAEPLFTTFGSLSLPDENKNPKFVALAKQASPLYVVGAFRDTDVAPLDFIDSVAGLYDLGSLLEQR